MEMAFSKDKTSDDLLAELTDLEISNGYTDQAISRLKTLIKENKNHSSAHKFLGMLYLKSINIDAARFHLETHNHINPNDYTIYSQLASVYESSGTITDAIKFYKKDLVLRPANVNSTLSAASLLEKTGNINDAINLYEKALEIDSNNILAANNLAVLLINNRDDDSSLKRANQLLNILKRKQELTPVQDTIGWIHYKSGRYQEADSHLEKALSQAPDIPTFNYHFGMNQIKMGNTDIAIKYLKLASEHGTGNDKSKADKALASLVSATSSSAD